MDENKRVSTGLGEFTVLPDAVEGYDVSMYKQLINTDKLAVYNTASGMKFI
jgi:hypothetical protein